MATPKRTRTDGQLSKEDYNAISEASSPRPTGSFPVADKATMAVRNISRTGARKINALNKSFDTSVMREIAECPSVDLSPLMSDYLSYSSQLQRRYFKDVGQVMICGNGDCGQLGFGMDSVADMNIKVPRVLPGLESEKITMVACGGICNTALTADGRVFTWGAGDDGTLGRDGDELFPALVEGDLKGEIVVQVASGDCQSLAVCLSGKVFGWGCHKDKEGKQWFQPPAGAGPEKCKRCATSPVEILGFSGKVAEVRCGASFNLALTEESMVYSWGLGEQGELGREVCAMRKGEDTYDFEGILRDHLTPGPMFVAGAGVAGRGEEKVGRVKAIGCGDYHALVITRFNNECFSTGLNSYGQLGLGDAKARNRLAHVAGVQGTTPMALAAGSHHSLVLCLNGVLYSFGRDDSGQLGVTETLKEEDWGRSVSHPTKVPLRGARGKASRIECGANHCLAVTDEHEVFTWGYGDSCALGLGNDKDYGIPTKVNLSKVIWTLSLGFSAFITHASF